MNKKLVSKMLGFILLLEAVSMLPPLFVSLYFHGTDTLAFLLSLTIAACAGCLFVMLSQKESGNMYARESFLSVGLCWILLSVFGALPYYISGVIPDFVSCLFESVSGFTTTGSTVLTQADSLPKGILLWQSQTNWMGGLGVLALSLIVMSSIGGRAQSLLKAEVTGPSPGKMVPRIADSVKIIYIIYVSMTVLQIILLIIAGLKPFDAVIVSFSTVSTGGSALASLSIDSAVSAAVEIIAAVFMLLSSISFSIYYAVIAKKWLYIKNNTELKFFGIILSVSIVAIWMNIAPQYGYTDGFEKSFFHTVSIMSSTGLSTVDFNLWPDFSRFILITLMILGACGGSTSGGIKVSRAVILFKAIHRELKKIMHPRSVPIVRVDGKALDDAVTLNVLLFFASYMFIIFGAALVLSLDNLDFTTTLTSAIQAISNAGVGLGQIGPTGDFSIFSPLSKIMLSFCMLAGRLEIFPILILVSPSAWRRK